ncbi:ParB N-terminal domain-containing protein [bacterium]|nr:ParB N-terminal domain-containing protein [bacterium]
MPKKKTTTIEQAAPKVHAVQLVPDEMLFDHPNNTNRQSKHVHQELIESIREQGFDENLIVVPRNDGEPGFFIVAGNHRRRAGKAAGMLEFPCVVRDDWDEVEARIQLVRRNYVRGEIDRVLFTEEVNRLSKEQGIALDVLMERMGFEDANAFSNFYKEEKKREKSIGASVAASQAASQVKMIDDLGVILSVLFEKYGNTVPHSFIAFPTGGKNHIFIQVTPALKKTMDAVTTKCVADGLDINTVLGGLLQIAIHHTNFFKAGKDQTAVVDAGAIEGDDNLTLIGE